MVEPGELHASIRTDLTAALRELDPESVGDRHVPACPEWRVRDVVAHLVGVASDVLAGNLEGVASDPWTAAQVDARRGKTLSEILEEWEELDPQVEAISSAFGSAEHQWLMDCMTHDFDVRGALGLPVDRASDGFGYALGFIAGGYHAVNELEGRVTPELRVDDDRWTGPGGSDVAVLAPDRFELLRGLTGRRSVDQIAAWIWSQPANEILDTFSWGPFTARAEPLNE